jgi:GNAT superfamily N-acetyltransferase
VIIPYSNDYKEEVTGLISEFFSQSLTDSGLNMDDGAIERIAPNLITFLLLEEGRVIGLIGGTVSEQPLSVSLFFQELVWYVSENHRSKGVKLLKHLEEWCISEGIDQIVMAGMHNSQGERLGKFYERNGYSSIETHYLKNLGA